MTAIPPAVTPTSPAVDTCAAPESARVQAIAEEAYIYGFPLLAAYKAMYQFNIDRASSQYKAGFNDLVSEARLFTPEDTAIVTPNSDTPYSMVQLDLRAEPMVLRVPTVEPHRYYSIQLVTQSTFNFGYIGTRATGSEAGCYMVTGPGWNGETPKGIVKTFASETHFALAVYRTQLFDADDLDNVRKVQSGYTAMPLSSFLKQAPASAAPAIDFPEFTPDCIKGGSLALLNFLLQFSPESPEESEMRARFAEIGVVSARPFALE